MKTPRTRLALVLAALSLLLVGGCNAIQRFAYEGFDRDDWQQPDRVVAALALRPGDRVADLGAGGGYFTFRLAEAVGPEGRVMAVDVDPDMLAYIREESAERGLRQVVTVEAAPEQSNLPVDSVDLVFVSNTFHHLPDPPAYFARLRQALRPGGRVAVVELREGGFPPGHFTSPEQVRADMAAAGYERVAHHDWLEKQSFQVFAPRPAPRAADGP